MLTTPLKTPEKWKKKMEKGKRWWMRKKTKRRVIRIMMDKKKNKKKKKTKIKSKWSFPRRMDMRHESCDMSQMTSSTEKRQTLELTAVLFTSWNG